MADIAADVKALTAIEVMLHARCMTGGPLTLPSAQGQASYIDTLLGQAPTTSSVPDIACRHAPISCVNTAQMHICANTVTQCNNTEVCRQ